MAYHVYLDGEQLPVTPGRLRLTAKSRNLTLDLLEGGELNLPRAPGLWEAELQALLPQRWYPFANRGRRPIGYYLEKWDRLKREKRHFQFIVSRMGEDGSLRWGTDLTMVLEEYQIREDAEALGDDVLVSLRLREWRQGGWKAAGTADGGAGSGGQPPRDTSTAPQATEYTVKKGDCLWNIAKQFLGDGSRWREIYQLNQEKIVNPNRIYPGQVLVLP